MKLLNKTAKVFKSIFHLSGKTPHSPEAFDELQKRIDYHFRNLDFLRLALTHKSSSGSEDKKGLESNERLEFLGDAVLDCLVTEHLYHKFPTYSEGQLSKIKSLLVSRKIIGEVAASINLSKYIIVGQSEKKSSRKRKSSIESNAFEAVLGAIYLDGDKEGIEMARKVLESVLYNNIEEYMDDESNVNYKSKVLEIAQSDNFGIPVYPLIREDGPDHAKSFTVGIEIAGVRLGEGSGSNKKEAQQKAAFVAIKNYDKNFILGCLKGEGRL